MPDLASLAFLAFLEFIAALLRWLHQNLDANRHDGGYYTVNSLEDDVADLNAQGEFTKACILEISALSPVVRPLVGTLILRQQRKIEAIATAFVEFGVSFFGVILLASRHMDAIELFAERLAPDPNSWQNSLLTAALMILVSTIGFAFLPMYNALTQCRSRKCRADGGCACQYDPRARLAWSIVDYGIELTAITVGGIVSGKQQLDPFFLVPMLIFGLSILTLGSYLGSRSEDFQEA